MKPFIPALALALASSIVSVAAIAAEPAATPAAAATEDLLKNYGCKAL